MDHNDWDARYAAADLVWSAEPNRWVEEEVADLPPGRAVDLAAGEGRNSLWMAGLGWHVTTVDFSPVAIDKARRLAETLVPEAAARLTFVVGDVRDELVEPAAFDLALLCYLQVPEADRRLALARAATALRPGGCLLVVGHAAANVTDGTGGPQDPAVCYDPDQLVHELPAEPALELERAELVRRPVEGAPRAALDTIVRARRPA